jgi:hypothetical protein
MLSGAALAGAGAWSGSMQLIWGWIQDAVDTAVERLAVSGQEHVELALARELVEAERAEVSALRQSGQSQAQKQNARALQAFEVMLDSEVKVRRLVEARLAELQADYEDLCATHSHLIEQELRAANAAFGGEPPADIKGPADVVRPRRWRRPAAVSGPTTFGTLSADQSSLS